jgi:hypothetical protein
MRGYKIRQLGGFDPLTPTLSRKQRELVGQPRCFIFPCHSVCFRGHWVFFRVTIAYELNHQQD